MKGYSYYNGRYSLYNSEEIGTYDRALFFGDGVYDVMIGGKGKIYQQELHLNRLRKNATAIDIPFEKNDEELSVVFNKLIEYSKLDYFIVYIQVSRYSDKRLHEAGDENISNILITVTPYIISDKYCAYSLITENDIRHRMCNIKTLNLLPAVLASRKAKKSGCDEAVFIYNGKVTECAHSNIFIIKNGILYTHKTDNSILPGIMRHNILTLCKKLKIQVCEKEFTKEEMLSADEILISSTTKFAKRVCLINGESCGMSDSHIAYKIIDKLYSDFDEFINK